MKYHCGHQSHLTRLTLAEAARHLCAVCRATHFILHRLDVLTLCVSKPFFLDIKISKLNDCYSRADCRTGVELLSLESRMAEVSTWVGTGRATGSRAVRPIVRKSTHFITPFPVVFLSNIIFAITSSRLRGSRGGGWSVLLGCASKWRGGSCCRVLGVGICVGRPNAFISEITRSTCDLSFENKKLHQSTWVLRL